MPERERCMVREIIKFLFPKSVFSIKAEVHREYAKLGVRKRFRCLDYHLPMKEGELLLAAKMEAYIER